MAVLYRKYRPQTFADVLNQKFIIQTLKNQVMSGGVAHAYLFTGSRGVGKTSIARILAKAVNCKGFLSDSGVDKHESGDACGACEVCKAVEQGNFIDLVEIDAASNTSVENVRDLIEHVRFAPSIGKFKVFIIDEVHMLSKSAFNALLKTLEEPPKHVIFILATTEINKVPATIISRTQKFDFKALSQADLVSHLEKLCEEEGVKLDNSILELVAQNAEGSVRDSLSLLDKVLTLGADVTIEECQLLLGVTDIGFCEKLLELIVTGQAKEIPVFFNGITEKGLDYVIFNRDFLEYLRKALIFKITENNTNFGLSAERNANLNKFTEGYSATDIMYVIRLFLKSYKDLQNSPDPQVPLLVASLEGALKKVNLLSRPANLLASQVIVNPAGQESVQVKVEQPILESVIKPTKQESEFLEMESVQEEVETSNLTLAQVEAIWPKVIAKVKEANGPLASLLKNSPLIGVERGRIVLQSKFNFDKQNLESPKNTALIKTIVESISGEKIGLLAKVIAKDEKLTISASDAIGEALKVFGGEIIE